MSFLAPLYLLGMLALSLPLIFHLIRRTPRGRQLFSSLMFLSPSPPRLTRRSRLDNLLLLLLRALALTLLALAFMRPFLREATYLDLSGVRGRRVALIVDTSASMRRGDLWRQAQARVDHILNQLEPADDVALFTFDRRVRTVVDFDREQKLPGDRKAQLVKGRLKELGPSWGHTDLGTALVAVSEALDVTSDVQQSDAALQIMLISDLQRGAQLESLQAYQWPPDVRVVVEQLTLPETTNASLQLLADHEQSDQQDDEPRVRVTNASDSQTEQFYVAWSAAARRPTIDEATAAYVTPGQSRVVRVPRPAEQSSLDRLILIGDQGEFDNTFYVVPLRQEQVRLIYVGSDSADDPNGLRYYLELALAEDARRKVEIEARQTDEPLQILDDQLPRMIVVTETVSEPQRQELDRYLDRGGTLLLVPKNQRVAASLRDLMDHVVVGLEGEEEPVSDEHYVMLGEIDFTHPLFTSFAGPRYNDFTKIQFWKHRQISLNEDAPARVVARFDDGYPALWEQPRGSGKMFVLTSGWHPDDSQLALSSKFVPLMSGVLEQAGGGRPQLPDYTVGQLVPLPGPAAQDGTVGKPDGTQLVLAAQADRFQSTDQPGIYRVQRDGVEYAFAVNVAATESQTQPGNVEQLEQYGIRLGSQPSRSEQVERNRQLRDMELEGRQKLWQWMIILALCVLTLETWLAGRKTRRDSARGDAT